MRPIGKSTLSPSFMAASIVLILTAFSPIFLLPLLIID
jgi:hypothetical protein